jgi:hypothetical protein
MRQAHDMTIDRGLLLHLLALAEPYGFMTDVKLQQLAFLCELQMFNKRLRGFHFEFYRFPYGAFSKDLDNDLGSLRRKERVENFSPAETAADAVKLILAAAGESEANQKVFEILHAVVGTYGPQDASALTKAVEQVEISKPDEPEFKITLEQVSFHSILLVPHRIEVDADFTLKPGTLKKWNAALGYS